MRLKKIPAVNTGIHINKIMESLPLDEIEHMYRVGRLVEIMSTKLCETSLYLCSSSSDEEKFFGQAAAYHDIGKVFIPKSILSKPDKLTDEEYRIIKQHPVYAREIFNHIKEGSITDIPRHIIKLAFDAAVYHHEWWNGGGYPYGIASYKIPLIARITSICDAFDAITRDRPYRKAGDHLYARSELEAKAGTQFDPMLIRIFLDNERELSHL